MAGRRAGASASSPWTSWRVPSTRERRIRLLGLVGPALRHRLAHQVDDGVRAGQRGLGWGCVGRIWPGVGVDAVAECLAGAVRVARERHHLVAAREQGGDDGLPEDAGGAGDDYAHGDKDGRSWRRRSHRAQRATNVTLAAGRGASGVKLWPYATEAPFTAGGRASGEKSRPHDQMRSKAAWSKGISQHSAIRPPTDAEHADRLPRDLDAVAHRAAAGELHDAAGDDRHAVHRHAEGGVGHVAPARLDVRQHGIDSAMLAGDRARPRHVPDDVLGQQLPQRAVTHRPA